MLGFLKKKSAADNNGLVGVNVNTIGIAVAHVQSRNPGLPVIKACQFYPCSEPGQRQAILEHAVDTLGLKGLPVNFVLTPPQYSMLLVEQPNVPVDEMKQAVRWRIKDLVNFNVDNAAIDVVHLPDDAFRGRTMMIYVAAAPREKIDEVEQLLADSGLSIRSIDIAELAMCNLLLTRDTESHGVAMMHLAGEQGVLNLIKNQTLYLTRNINVDLTEAVEDLAESRAFNHLLLETQRSLDYYESQLGQPPATELLLTPQAESSSELKEALNSNLGLKVQQMAIGEVVEGADKLTPELQQQCLLAIAGALRHEQA